jgi:hypothetical protein
MCLTFHAVFPALAGIKLIEVTDASQSKRGSGVCYPER